MSDQRRADQPPADQSRADQPRSDRPRSDGPSEPPAASDHPLGPRPSGERLHAVVHGTVQGVGYRWFVDRIANELGLTGWVANRSGGIVEVVAEGPPHQLDDLAAALRRGPANAWVHRVDEDRGPATREFSRFHIRSGSHPGD
jgi:acylphosphatase